MTSLYYEVTLPGSEPRYVQVAATVAPGSRHRVAVLEIAGRTGWWRVWVDGRPIDPPVHLPGSSAWRPIATAESWDGGAPSCNRYSYRFDRVALAMKAGGSWRDLSGGYLLQDDGYQVVRRSPAAFSASASA